MYRILVYVRVEFVPENSSGGFVIVKVLVGTDHEYVKIASSSISRMTSRIPAEVV